jgi:hypothetical protein
MLADYQFDSEEHLRTWLDSDEPRPGSSAPNHT